MRGKIANDVEALLESHTLRVIECANIPGTSAGVIIKGAHGKTVNTKAGLGIGAKASAVGGAVVPTSAGIDATLGRLAEGMNAGEYIAWTVCDGPKRAPQP
jgi:hypothetical protein